MKLFTVGDLKRKLAQIPDDVVIVRKTHFGDAIAVEESAFHWQRTPVTIVDSAWQIAQPHHTEFPRVPSVLAIEPPDIGPEPD
jgi:hypothetical protein